MNGYLVVANCDNHDVPARLFPDRAAAVRYAAGLTAKKVAAAAGRIAWVDMDEWEGLNLVHVVQFVGGVPVGGELAADFRGPLPVDAGNEIEADDTGEDDGDRDGWDAAGEWPAGV